MTANAMDHKPVGQPQDDRILPLTRLVAGVTVFVLIFAALILYFFPAKLHSWLPWDIQPNLTAAFMGAGYLGGGYQLLFSVFEKRWHRVMNGFLPIVLFSLFMLIATLLHLDRFNFSQFSAQFWMALYILAPIFFPLAWIRNRVTDSGAPEVSDAVVPLLLRIAFTVIATGLLLFSVVTFIIPVPTIQYWPWKLTPLTARVLAGWFSLLGLGGLLIARETRWSGWRLSIQSIFLWDIFVLLAVFLYREDLTNSTAPLFLGLVVLSIVVLLGLLIFMERLRHRSQG